MDVILVAGAVLAFIYLSIYSSALQKLLGSTYRLPLLEPITGEDVPEDILDFLQRAAKPVVALGFRFSGYSREQHMNRGEDCISWVLHLVNEDWQTEARLSAAISPNRYDPIALSFATRFEDGTQLASQNSIGVVDPLKTTRFHFYDPEVDRVSDLWDRHQQQLQKLEEDESGKSRQLGTLAENIAAYNGCWQRDRDIAVDEGRIRAVGDEFNFTFSSALSLLRQVKKREKTRLLGRQRRRRQAQRDEDGFATLGSKLDLTAVQTYAILAELEQRRAAPSRGWHSWAFFLMSMALFGLFFGIWLGWALVPVLIGVLLFHEMGHYLAMRMVGYDGLNVFFIPGLGAAVTGHSESASTWQRIFVYLAGPLPGIVLAFALMFLWPGEQSGWLEATILILIILNWFNLLPFAPLDGGQVVNALLGIRGQQAFKWISAVCLLGLAWLLAEPILWVVGGFSLITAFSFGITAQLKRTLKDEEVSGADRLTYLRQVVTALQAPQYDELDLPDRSNTVDQMLQDRLVKHPGIAGMAGGLSLYMLMFLAPVWMFVIGLATTGSFETELFEETDWQAEIAAAAVEGRELEVTLQAIDYQLDYYDLEQARSYLDQAWSLPGVGAAENESALLLAEMRLSLRESEYGEVTPDLTRHLARYYSLSPPLNEDWVEVLQEMIYQLPWDGEPDPRDMLHDLMAEAKSGARLPPSADSLFLSAAMLQREEGHYDQAQHYLEFGIWLDGEQDSYLRNELAALLLDLEDYAGALQVYGSIPESELYTDDLEMMAWAHLLQGNNEEGTRLMERSMRLREEDSDGGWLLWLMSDFDYGEQMILQGYIMQLAAYDHLNQAAELNVVLNEIRDLDEDDDGSLLQDQREVLRSELQYAKGFRLRIARMKLQALDRYFAEA